MQQRLCAVVASILWLMGSAHPAATQVSDVASRGPRFLYAAAATTSASSPGADALIDASGAAILRRSVSVALADVSLAEALGEIARNGNLQLIYSGVVLPVGRRVSLEAKHITVAAALTEVLIDTGIDVVLTYAGQMTLARREVARRPGVIATGTVVGRVTDAKTAQELGGVDVSLEGTRWHAVTGANGRYRIEGVAPGTYSARARYIGYSPGLLSVTVTEAQEASADFALAKSAQRLDEVVTTGTLVPTEVKALPTPITVITAKDIELQHPRRFDELLRLAVPGAVVQESDGTANPSGQDVSFRGRSSFNGGGNSNPKVYIDGIETAERGFLAIDPQSIERVEVLRGPQASAIYGSDAMGGVVQIFTKRGAGAGRRPEIDASAALGRIESAFPDNSGALKQDYGLAVSGRTGSGSYRVGASYRRTGDWLPDFDERLPSLHGALTLEEGPLTVDLTGRYEQAEFKQGFNSLIVATGSPFAYPTVPNYDRTLGQNDAIGLRLAYRATAWWQHEVTVGIDRHSDPYEAYRPARSTPADTLLYAGEYNTRRLSLAYHTVLTATMARGLTGTLTAGADHYVRNYEGFNAFGAYTVQPLALDPVLGGVFAFRQRVTNSGVFAQTQFNFREALFLTASVRAEDNSEFGTALSWPRSTRAGLTYVHDIGSVTIKLRTSYGQAIRPPIFGGKDSTFSKQGSFTIIQLSQPGLRPERQHGPDGGLDLVFGRRGTLSVTYYDQAATDFVVDNLVTANDTLIATQFVNVGRVRNRGWEFEGTVNVGWVTAKGNFAITHTRPEDLGPVPADPLDSVGKQFGTMPTTTGAIVLTASPLRTTSVTVGAAYLGSTLSFDGLAYYRCSGGTGPCQPTIDGYYVTYPSVTKLNVALDQQFSRVVSGYLSVEDATNRGVRLSLNNNAAALPGRISTIGLRIRY